MKKIRLIFPTFMLMALLCACPSEDKSIEFQFLTIPRADCNDPQAAAIPLPQGTYSLRLTLMQRELGPITPNSLRKYQLICDRIIQPGEHAQLKLPQSSQSLYTVRVDAFNTENGMLEYSGQIENLDLSQSTGKVYLRPTAYGTFSNNAGISDGRSCAGDTNSYRAFHSATLLPNGQVLLVGGISTDKDGKARFEVTVGEAYTTGSIEVYDPASQRFENISSTVPPRAFHQAILLPTQATEQMGPYKILLFGGVQPQGAESSDISEAINQPTFQLKAKYQVPFPFTPHPQAEAAPAALLTYFPSSGGQTPRVEYQPLSDWPKSMFPATENELTANTAIIAGGGDGYSNTEQYQGFQSNSPILFIDLSAQASAQNNSPQPFAQANLNKTRVGHALARLGDNRYLILGGMMNGPEQGNSEEEIITNSESSRKSDPIDLGLQRYSIAWHSLTPWGITDGELLTPLAENRVAPIYNLLWAGGVPLDRENDNLRATMPDGLSLQLPFKSLYWIKDGNPPQQNEVSTEGVAEHFTLALYHEAVRLYDGSILISGGKEFQCKKTTLCPLNQMSIYQLSNDGPNLRQEPKTPLMYFPRFGHRMTRLLDNTILITGGFSEEEDQGNKYSILLKTAEIYNPRTGDFREDFPFEREANNDSTAKDIVTGIQCPLR